MIIFSLSVNSALSLGKYVYNIQNDVISLDTIPKPYFVIFFQNPSCLKCLETLGNVLDSISQKNINTIVVINTLMSPVSRKTEAVFVKNRINYNCTYYVAEDFLYLDRTEEKKQNRYNKINSIFNDYKIVNTPALLYVCNEGEYFFNYNELFPLNYESNNIITMICNKINKK